MPRRNGTGPMGLGSMTGRGKGFCNISNVTKVAGVIGGLGLGLGLGCRRGFGRNSFVDNIEGESKKDLLMKQKAALENSLKVLNDQLNNIKDK